MVLKADLADRQRDLQAAKAERQSEEQKAWETEDELKQVKLDHRKAEQGLNEIVRMHDQRLEELRFNNQEIDRQEQRLEKINHAIEVLSKDEVDLQNDL